MCVYWVNKSFGGAYEGTANPPSEEDLNAPLDGVVGDVDTELGQARDGGGANDRVLENDPVVNVSDVLVRLRRLRTFDTEQVQDADRKLGKLAVLDELAELSESCGGVKRVRDEIGDREL